MNEAPIALVLSDHEGTQGFLQPLAGLALWSAREITAGATPAPRPEVRLQPPAADWRLVYDGPGLVEGRLQRISSWIEPSGFRRVDFEDGESFLVDGAGTAVVRRRRPQSRERPESTLERALGGPLALALALRGIYLLHASALVIDRRVVALTAESGGGKSTAAAAAASLSLERIADDQLPVRLGQYPRALPHFPQPKLAAEAHYPAEAPASLRLLALVEIGHAPTTEETSLERLPQSAASLALARATVAARLFDRALLAEHFVATTNAAASCVVARLSYPSGVERLPAVLATLRDWARTLA